MFGVKLPSALLAERTKKIIYNLLASDHSHTNETAGRLKMTVSVSLTSIFYKCYIDASRLSVTFRTLLAIFTPLK
jgi:hypothetical protein